MSTIEFGGKLKSHSFLSNFYMSDMIVDGILYPHVEAYFQSQKFDGIDEALQTRIRRTISPYVCKKVGRNSLLPRWRQKEWINGLRDNVMKRALLCKFVSNKDLFQALIDTGDSELVEISISDTYWAKDKNGNGENKLGKLLMELRGKLKLLSDKSDDSDESESDESNESDN